MPRTRNETSSASSPRRDLVEEGLEGVEVVGVDQHDLHALAEQASGRRQAPEPRPDDDDVSSAAHTLHSRLHPMAVVGEHHPAFEEYCERIFELAEDDVDVIQARIADRLQVSRPRGERDDAPPRDRGADHHRRRDQPHERGHRAAERVVRRHRLAERFLTDVLELSWAEAHHEAGRWEHVMSEHVEKAMSRLLGNPTSVPAWQPDPGLGLCRGGLPPLAEVDVGDGFIVRRITEELEFRSGLLESLEESALQPGT